MFLGTKPSPASHSSTTYCSFKLIVQEATHVSEACRSLCVRWRKGTILTTTKCASVERNRAEWNESLTINALLFRGTSYEGRITFETKFCSLEIAEPTRDGWRVLGHAQIDLSQCCDGKAHEQTVPVRLPNRATAHDHDSKRLQLKVSIVALGSPLSGMYLPASFVEGGAVSAVPIDTSSVPRSLPADFLSAGDQTPHLGSSVGLSSPAVALAMPSPTSRLLGGISPGRPSLQSRQSFQYEAAHPVCASALADLPSRLVALVDRQCRRSNLNSVEIDDGLRILLGKVRLRLDRLHDGQCGLLFTHAPLHGLYKELPGSTAAVTCAQEASQSVFSDNNVIACLEPRSPEATVVPAAATAPVVSGSPKMTLMSPSALPAGITASLPDCTGHLYELLSHLSHIRSLALTLQRSHDAAALSTPCPCACHEETTRASACPTATPRQPVSLSSQMPSVQAVAKQILGCVAKAVAIGELVLREVGAQQKQLLSELEEMSRDRLLWMARHGAIKDSERIRKLCVQAATMDSTDSCDRQLALA